MTVLKDAQCISVVVNEPRDNVRLEDLRPGMKKMGKKDSSRRPSHVGRRLLKLLQSFGVECFCHK